MTTNLSLRQKSVLDLVKKVSVLKSIIRRWFYYVGFKFIQGRNLTEEQELFLEEVTNFFLDNLEHIEEDKSFLRKVELAPIKLPNKKRKDSVEVK